MIYVYALKSLHENYIYVGMTNNLERRFNEHNLGRARSTHYFAPYRIIYHEVCADRAEARKREKYLKSGVGKEFLRNLEMF